MSSAVGGGDSVLVIDVGTSGVRAGVVRPDATVQCVHHKKVLPSTPAVGLVEVNGREMADAVIEVARAALGEAGPVGAIGIANQRATTLVWDRETGVPVAPGIGWQDLRTVVTCLVLQADGVRLAPNMSATKLSSILDAVDPTRKRSEAGELCFGTVDSWVAWTLARAGGSSGGASGGGNRSAGDADLHVTDATNAAVTGLVHSSTIEWDERILERLRIPEPILPRIVDSSGEFGEARALQGAPMIAGIAGDQQASLIGQGCTRTGQAKATFGTGGMLDLCTERRRAVEGDRGGQGTFSIMAWRRNGTPTWGVEAVMLSAGTCIEWLVEDLGVIEDAASSESVAAACDTTDDVWFVPALLGLGTPVWDFGARGTMLGITRGTGRPEIVRAVLEGVAHRGADLLESAESDSGCHVDELRVDGGMSANAVFVQALADATGRPIAISRQLEATTLGAGFLAGMAIGTWRDENDVASAYSPARTVEPSIGEEERTRKRERWYEARRRSLETVPELSGIAF